MTCVLDTGAAAVVLECQADIGVFDYFLMKLAGRDVRLLARELIRQRDGKGWVTPNRDIDQHLPGLMETILSDKIRCRIHTRPQRK